MRHSPALSAGMRNPHVMELKNLNLGGSRLNDRI